MYCILYCHTTYVSIFTVHLYNVICFCQCLGPVEIYKHSKNNEVSARKIKRIKQKQKFYFYLNEVNSLLNFEIDGKSYCRKMLCSALRRGAGIACFRLAFMPMERRQLDVDKLSNPSVRDPNSSIDRVLKIFDRE